MTADRAIRSVDPAPVAASLRRVALGTAAAVAALGAIALAGWVTGLRPLATFVVGSAPMNANAAAAVLASGAALLLLAPARRPRIVGFAGRALATLVALFAVATLVEHVSRHALGIDALLARGAVLGGQRVPERMSVGTCITLLLLALSILTIDMETRTRRHPAWALALGAALVPFQAVVAWLYGVETLQGHSPFTQVSLPAGIAFALTSAGVLLARAEHGFVRVVASPGSAGFTARRLLVTIVILPVLLGWVFAVAVHRAAHYEAMVGASLIVVSAIVTGVLVVWLTAREVQRMDEVRSAVEDERALLLAREREARAEAEHASRAKDEFIATLSHELRTPLNSVLGWARLLRGGKLDAAGIARAVQAIERGATTQAQIVDDLLDVARIVKGQLRLDVRPVDLGAIVNAALETVRPAAAARDIALSATIEPRLPAVSGDPGRLQQIAWNLLTNAIKFTPAGGSVDVRAAEREGAVELVVADTGDGIAPEFLPHVFERFRQADSSTTRSHGGLGLGLAIVRHLVEAHGGAVSAESAGRGLGSTFRVVLPVYQSRPRPRGATPARTIPPVAPPPPPAVALGGVRVLVVDDDADTLAVVGEILELAGAHVVSAGSADDALALLATDEVDVVVSDLGMPGKDGCDLIRSIRALPSERARSVPAAALTAFTHSEHRHQALSAGYQLYLSKPIDPGQLTLAVAQLVGRAA